MQILFVLVVIVLAALGAIAGWVLYNRRPRQAEGEMGERTPRKGIAVGAVIGALLGIAIWVTAHNWGATNAETYGAATAPAQSIG